MFSMPRCNVSGKTNSQYVCERKIKIPEWEFDALKTQFHRENKAENMLIQMKTEACWLVPVGQGLAG